MRLPSPSTKRNPSSKAELDHRCPAPVVRSSQFDHPPLLYVHRLGIMETMILALYSRCIGALSDGLSEDCSCKNERRCDTGHERQRA
jgi:hypothetical protein